MIGTETRAISAMIAPPGRQDAPVRLTPTQMKVMRGVHLGLLNKQIAFNLGIAEKTVKAHMTELMRRLNVSNRTQVAIAAQTVLEQHSPGTGNGAEARRAWEIGAAL